jgi:hypothetical protein
VTKLSLHQGAYQARSPIANAQVCINLYPESNPQDAPFPVTHYPGPGLTLLSDFSSQFTGFVRGIYETSNGAIVIVIGTNVISWHGPGNTSSSYVFLGNLPSDTGKPVSMCDNQTDLVIVDGTPGGGWYIPLTSINSGTIIAISDPAFYGSTRVDFIDTFLIFNSPGTPSFYSTTSNVLLPFDPTYFAGKEGWNDLLICVAALHDNIWLLGNTTTEIWFNAGGATFPFARMPNSILQQGCVAPYSVVIADNAIYWLSQDRWGRNLMMRGEGYSARRISTFAVEDEWATYPTLEDAVAMTYQLSGHEIIGVYFPTGATWWAYDASTQLWHKRTYSDLTTPWLPFCMSGWGGVEDIAVGKINQIIAGDRTGARIYGVDRKGYTDNGVAIHRQRSWAHVQDDGQRIYHSRFSLSFAGAAMLPDTISLDWSDDAGQTYGTAVPQTINNQTNGQYQWRRLGYARDRVYRATWSGSGEHALNGAWADVTPGAT